MFTIEQRHVFEKARMSRDARFDGMFFIGVKTTGIFCRPICPANSPKEQNVDYYPSPQQAMADGYRPCLRCRPDSAPGSFAWIGVSTSQQRALKLLKDDLDQSIATVAERMGISERYLHKLVTQVTGVNPKQYRLYSQILLAKQLLHQSALSVESVAQASGFSSSRSLQMQMKKMTGLTPSQIRRTQKTVTENAIQLRLHFRPPYNWPLLRDFLANRAISPIEAVTNNSYSKIFNVTQNGSVERFTATYAHADNAFDIELYVEDVSRIANVIKTIKRILDLDADPTIIQSSLHACGLSHDSIDEGIRLPGVWSPFEAGCRAIIGQQISVKAAIQHIQNIVTHLSNDNPAAFPSPKQIIALDDALLKMPNARKRALKNFAQCFIDETEPDEKTLLAVKGIGPWTVNYVKLRGMSDPDLLLETDLIVANQLKARSLETDSAAPFRSYLTLQLWQLSGSTQKESS